MRISSASLALAFTIFSTSYASPEGFPQSLKSTLFDAGTVLGKLTFVSGQETDVIIQFFSDGTAEYNIEAPGGTSCTGRLDFVGLYEDQPDYQTIDFEVTLGESSGSICPVDGRVVLSRSIYTENKDEIFVGFQSLLSLQSEGANTASGGVFLREGFPLNQDFAKADIPTKGATDRDPSTVSSVPIEYPIYDGVYVGLVDGTYLQMEELVRADSRLHFGGMPYAITRPFSDPANNRPAPIVDLDDIRSIFVKSGTDVVTAIQPVFDAEGLLFQGGWDVPDAWVLVGQAQFPSSEFKSLFAASDCAYLPKQMNRLSISDTEYELVFDGSQISPRNLASAPVNKKWSASNPSYSPDSPNECAGKVSSRGFSVVVEGPTHRGINTILGPIRGSVYWVQFK